MAETGGTCSISWEGLPNDHQAASLVRAWGRAPSSPSRCLHSLRTPAAKFNPCIVATVLLEEGQVGDQVEAEVRACLSKVLEPLAIQRVDQMKASGVL